MQIMLSSMEEREQERRDVLSSLSLLLLCPDKSRIPTALSNKVCVTTERPSEVLYNTRYIPRNERWNDCLGDHSRPKTLHLRTAATALLGVKEDNKSLSKLFVGDRLGQLHVIQLPTFALEYTTNVSDSTMRAMCIDGDGALVAADAKGNIWNIDSKGNPELMFATNRSISSIRIEGQTIRIQSGWEQCLYNLNGDLANSKNASHSFGDNLMLRRMRERKKTRGTTTRS